MKYLGSSFTIALGGDAFSEGYDRIDWSKRSDPDGVPPQSHETPNFSPEPAISARVQYELVLKRMKLHHDLRPTGLDTGEMTHAGELATEADEWWWKMSEEDRESVSERYASVRCKNCGQWKRDHHEVETLGGPNLCCLKIEGAENLAMNEMIVLSERYWFKAEDV